MSSKVSFAKSTLLSLSADMNNPESFDEPLPAVGIFWFDTKERTLFGVCKQEVTPKAIEVAAEKGLPFINCPKLHHNVWQKEYFRAVAENKKSPFLADYEYIPRGRVSWNINRFIVLVGKWAEDCEDELTQHLKNEFSLPSFEFVYDEHWNIGHTFFDNF